MAGFNLRQAQASKRKGPPERPMVPKATEAFALPCQLAADRLAGCRRVDARFTLAGLDTGLWTLCLFDVGPVGRRSLSALVVIGARHCWRGMVRETRRSTNINPTPNFIYGPDERRGYFVKYGAM